MTKPPKYKERKLIDIRDPKTWHIALKQHASHDVHITENSNHTYLWCRSCSPNNNGYLIFKTNQEGHNPVGFPIGR